METVDCLLCGGAERKVRFRGGDRIYHQPGEFSLVECARCGFLYLSPRPDENEIRSYYPMEYRSFPPAVYEDRSILRSVDRMLGLRARCQMILRYKQRGDLLDLGCATGDFLAVMRSYAGWRVRGLEPHAGAARQARERYGLRVDEGGAETLPYAPGSFDVVTMWDVLEHVRDPIRTLRRVYEILRPAGLVVLSLPNRDSWDAVLFGRYWAGLDIPRHFSIFSPRHIAQALESSGFSSMDIVNLSGSFHAFALSARHGIEGRSPISRVRRTAADAIDSLPFQVVTYPYFQLVKRLKKATGMIVIARTPSAS